MDGRIDGMVHYFSCISQCFCFFTMLAVGLWAHRNPASAAIYPACIHGKLIVFWLCVYFYVEKPMLCCLLGLGEGRPSYSNAGFKKNINISQALANTMIYCLLAANNITVNAVDLGQEALFKSHVVQHVTLIFSWPMG